MVFWTKWFGYWGSIVAYAVPPGFVTLYAVDQISWSLDTFPTSFFLMVGGYGLWVIIGLIHILFAKRMENFFEAKGKPCMCKPCEVPETGISLE